jgi:hypothetical protein
LANFSYLFLSPELKSSGALSSYCKITFAKMGAAGVRQVLIYCREFKSSHLNVVPVDVNRRPDESHAITFPRFGRASRIFM